MSEHRDIDINGLLAASLKNFSPRPPQLMMAHAVAQALTQQEMLVVEAGTGTGKTFAYLIPALLAQQKVIISTGTKNLQDQLFERDLPFIRRALQSRLKTALLKGRANYLCLQRLDTYAQAGFWGAKPLAREWSLAKQWARQTQTGDIAELAAIPEDSPIWPYITSTIDNCLGQDCPSYKECFLVKARRVAQEADLLVVNHHLFFADIAVRDNGFGELLPGVQAVIFDEAHQLIETATHFLGDSFSSRQLQALARDVIAEQSGEAFDLHTTETMLLALQQSLVMMHNALGREHKGVWSHIVHKKELQTAIAAVKNHLQQLQTQLELSSGRTKGLENCWKRCLALYQKFTQITQLNSEQQVHWYQTHTQSFSIHLTPLTVAQQFRDTLQKRPGAWIFTSATLALGEDFSHFVQNLGLEQAKTLKLLSPFDYATQSLLYVPQGLPAPDDEFHTQRVIDAAIPVIQAAQGRTFFLFTSHRALKIAAERLATRLEFPLLIQGTMPKAKLLAEFQRLGNVVLLGTGSFWEGVDVQNGVLACVIIDKLPFAAPDDPVLKARVAALKQQGRDPFWDHQLPRAVISLKQGAGRLIRDTKDKGVLMLGDPRLFDKNYGKLFLNSLPPMPQTREFSVVEKFFSQVAVIS
jgi:ATP-dependent DNA helicase DinG